MQQPLFNKPVRIISIITLIIFIAYGLAITIFPILPFWVDEWFLLENIKFKSAAQLWHNLDRLQQFPRVYLELIKAFASANDYSYTSLRLPSFLMHCAGVAFLYKLSGRIFKKDVLSRFLWIMLYISFNTSIHYFAQVKQYTMEMALSLVAIWQFLEIIGLETKQLKTSRYLLLCASFVICPFFSYTYPIVMAPVYIIAGLRAVKFRQWRPAVWLPLCIGMVAVAVFYLLDVRHVLADQGMQDFWQDLLMKKFSVKTFFVNTYAMFGVLGSGDLLANVFGVLGYAAFIYCNVVAIKNFFRREDETSMLAVYSCVLLWVTLALFVAGKLPLGTFRLNCFLVPVLGLMIINLLNGWSLLKKQKVVVTAVYLLVFLGATATVYTTVGELATEDHAKKIRIYNSCNNALTAAQKEHLPVFVTPAAAYPFDDRWQGDWIIRTLPGYKVNIPLEIYPIPAADSAMRHVSEIKEPKGAAIVLDGERYMKISF
ncbi:hypothetical protein [Taibaiella soli]|uniref:Glycosyltransferase RgtA/B/C/D-like domain-containing protein n=1 Tax=Taibaiella soli TaxID=1649169 RepID=A0A2W2BXR1_9BACT|nr:hypothetical protein [Taibaiella soli]PZF72643.1 hypothetical protein DN068_12315 [Taibaiella soli]